MACPVLQCAILGIYVSKNAYWHSWGVVSRLKLISMICMLGVEIVTCMSLRVSTVVPTSRDYGSIWKNKSQISHAIVTWFRLPVSSVVENFRGVVLPYWSGIISSCYLGRGKSDTYMYRYTFGSSTCIYRKGKSTSRYTCGKSLAAVYSVHVCPPPPSEIYPWHTCTAPGIPISLYGDLNYYVVEEWGRFVSVSQTVTLACRKLHRLSWWCGFLSLLWRFGYSLLDLCCVLGSGWFIVLLWQQPATEATSWASTCIKACEWQHLYICIHVLVVHLYLLVIAIATKVFIGKLPATRGAWVIIG